MLIGSWMGVSTPQQSYINKHQTSIKGFPAFSKGFRDRKDPTAMLTLILDGFMWKKWGQ